jgi:hypothetical protein
VKPPPEEPKAWKAPSPGTPVDPLLSALNRSVASSGLDSLTGTSGWSSSDSGGSSWDSTAPSRTRNVGFPSENQRDSCARKGSLYQPTAIVGLVVVLLAARLSVLVAGGAA